MKSMVSFDITEAPNDSGHRVIYEVIEDQLVVLVVRVAHQKDVYRSS